MAIFLYNFSKIGLVRPGLTAAAAAVIRPEHAEGGQNHENRLFIERRCFRPILVLSGPSRPQKWIRLEILR